MNNYKANPNNIVEEMLNSIGEKNLDGLYSMIDKKALMEKLDLPDALSELETQKKVKNLAKTNKTDFSYFIGAGAYKRFIPAAISQISSRFEFNTAYTPYQPEISQGTLQVIYEFQPEYGVDVITEVNGELKVYKLNDLLPHGFDL